MSASRHVPGLEPKLDRLESVPDDLESGLATSLVKGHFPPVATVAVAASLPPASVVCPDSNPVVVCPDSVLVATMPGDEGEEQEVGTAEEDEEGAAEVDVGSAADV